ncbi:MAG: hypothetical protein BRC33_09985 [Cyanobacteria bacterium SW_9_44_58]|nr:MAG: hypothetical protein BRC33_09985 [Cyanobacteria bacterium SW_9_44_58]
MSPLSNPDRPYKSQVFNWINRQSFRLRDRAQISFRKLKTATVWGIQIIAYPFYLLLQTSTQLGKQLQSKALKLLSPEKEENSDSVGSQPTVVALNSLYPWLENTPYQLFSSAKTEGKTRTTHQATANLPSDSTLPKPERRFPLPFLPQTNLNRGDTTGQPTYWIQGIATYLENGKLVLVTRENQTIDFLSDSQHEQLKQRIKILLECYEQIQQPWWWQIASQGDKGRFHPLRWLSHLMIWIQTSSLAKRLNLFQESQLRVSSGYSEISQTPPQSSSQSSQSGVMAKLDRALAHWETAQLSPVIEKIKQWRQQLDQQENPISFLIQAAVDYFYGGNSQNRLTGDVNANSDGSNPRKIPKLLKPMDSLIQQTQSIVNRGKNRIENAVAEDTADAYRIRQLIQAAIAYFFGKPNRCFADYSREISTSVSSNEPWLTKADLFGESDSPSSSATAAENNDDFSIAAANQFSSEMSSPATTTERSSTTDKETETTEADTTGEEWQTEGIPMGYEKHILARILEAMDRALAWLEDRLLKLWQWLKQWFLKQ